MTPTQYDTIISETKIKQSDNTYMFVLYLIQRLRWCTKNHLLFSPKANTIINEKSNTIFPCGINARSYTLYSLKTWLKLNYFHVKDRESRYLSFLKVPSDHNSIFSRKKCNMRYTDAHIVYRQCVFIIHLLLLNSLLSFKTLL